MLYIYLATCSRKPRYGTLRHYVETQVGRPPQLEQERLSFDAICVVTDIFLACKQRKIAPEAAGRQLLVALEIHMRRFIEAYSESWVRPKAHWLFHCALQLLEPSVNRLFDCLPVERLHLRVKANCEHVKNTTAFETSALCGVVHHQMRGLGSSIMSHALKGPASELPHMPGVLIVDKMDVNFTVNRTYRCHSLICLAGGP